MATTEDTKEVKCPSCAKIIREDLTKYDVKKNPWVSLDAMFLVLKALRFSPWRTAIVLGGVPVVITGILAAARFMIAPAPIASNAPAGAKVGVAAASMLRAPAVSVLYGASAFVGQPVTEQEVKALNAQSGVYSPFGGAATQNAPAREVSTGNGWRN